MKTLKMIFGAAYILAALLFFTACPDPPEEKGYKLQSKMLLSH